MRGTGGAALGRSRGAGSCAAEYYACLIGNHILGSGISSRLHQELRERRALVYGIQSRLEFYGDCGLWTIQAACDPREADDCRAAVAAAIADMLRDVIDIDVRELQIARRHLGAHLEIDEDHPESIMDRPAHEAIHHGRHPVLAERAQRLHDVDGAAVAAVLAQAWENRLFVRAG